MSADTPRQSRSQTKTSMPPMAATVTPQQVTDPTILDSVAGFINEVVPTAYNAPAELDDKIQWAHFEQVEMDESNFTPNFEDESAPHQQPSLILVLGYTTGIQIWAVPASGDATEILSWRHSALRILKLIPTPYRTGSPTTDLFASSRPLIALCDSSANYSSLTFRSLKSGAPMDPVKQIQFKSSVLNVLANRRSVVVSFAEKIAVFDAFTLESRISVTTCYLSPGLQQNPLALGSRWLAYAEKKLVATNRSGGGNDGEGVQSYTATVLHAAKSLGRGLRELTETVAGSLTGNPNFKPGSSSSSPQAGGASDVPQKGIVTVLDIEHKNINTQENVIPPEAVISHFVAQSEAVVCLSFDPTGMLLLTADKRGHDFHVFRIQPHPCGPSLAAVHHLYILHRGDTSAKVQDMCFSPDSRWATVSTLRGTTHVFPVTPYGGNVSVRTHATAHVVNKMSRYQRSAGLTSEGRSSSPVSLTESPPPSSLFPYRNSRFPPYPQPTVVHPLAQIRQPVYVQAGAQSGQQRSSTGRQRLPSSSSEDVSLRVVAHFAPPRAWVDLKTPRETTTHKPQVKPVESLFIMSCYGTLVQYDLDPRPLASVSRDKICNDTAIELKVNAKAQWRLHRQPNTEDVPLPICEHHLSLITAHGGTVCAYKKAKATDDNDDHWLSQVEIVTHLGPHRRLWMGPQFTFKTYTITNGTVIETRAVDVRRSKPVNMPVSKANAILIESGSANSCEQLFLDTYNRASDECGSTGETRLKEDLADAMLESPGIRNTGGHCVLVSLKPHAKFVNPLGTVVTVPPEDESSEAASSAKRGEDDAVIHENCDEALFRPVVAPKAVFYASGSKVPKICLPDKEILTRTVEPNTELVAVKIGSKKDDGRSKRGGSSTTMRQEQPIREVWPAKPKTKEKNERNNGSSGNGGDKLRSAGSRQVVQTPAQSQREEEAKPKPLTKREREVKAEINRELRRNVIVADDKIDPASMMAVYPEGLELLDSFSVELPPLDFELDDDIYIMEHPLRDISAPKQHVPLLNENFVKFEDAENCGQLPEATNKPFYVTRPNEVTNKQPLVVLEEPDEGRILLPRKTRKPKSKLGVKISGFKEVKEREKENVVFVDYSDVNNDPPPPPKKSWNVVAASKPPVKDIIIEPPLEMSDSVTNFMFTLPFSEEVTDVTAIECNPRDDSESGDDFNLLKIMDKSSDDEKPDSGSSPAETTTESDDSSKIPPIEVVDILDDAGGGNVLPALQTSSKTSKRKPKKKRK